MRTVRRRLVAPFALLVFPDGVRDAVDRPRAPGVTLRWGVLTLVVVLQSPPAAGPDLSALLWVFGVGAVSKRLYEHYWG